MNVMKLTFRVLFYLRKNAFRKYGESQKSHEIIVIYNTKTKKHSLNTLN
ncbi:hypothetical protein SAMN05444362_106126 [Dysgonomonas macrotermitis]|uniref:Uncharacterized protein n=1 Tax=Dysgonomonas macrotermitis TaxID=1346286 RepID=A0A1M5BMR1_9BACT|nr:hypothetical protein SAMN05444362_106126 [Dysgonomonas macrotermitis]